MIYNLIIETGRKKKRLAFYHYANRLTFKPICNLEKDKLFIYIYSVRGLIVIGSK